MNKSNSILLIDPSFEPANAPKCKLLVKVGLDSFSYAIVNKETNTVNAVFDEQECEDGAKKLAESLKNDSYLSLPYQEVKIAIHTDNMIAIPDQLFNPEEIPTYTQYFIAPHTENIYTSKQAHFGFTALFALPKITDELLENFIADKLPGQAGLFALAQNVVDNALFLDFTVTSFTTLYLKNGALVFEQCYEIENVEEFNYYILLMVNQLQIDPKTTAVYLSGIVHQGDEKYICLEKYFNRLAFTPVTQQLDQQVLDDMPAHYYSSLLALDQCE